MTLSQCCTPVRTVLRIAGDLVRLVAAAARSHAQLAELEVPLPVGFVYDAAGRVGLDPDRSVARPR
jgi:hypothetical protein